MFSTNCLYLRGRVGKDAMKVSKAVKINVATNRTYTDDKGERREITNWVTVTVLKPKMAEWVLANVKKGHSVYCEAYVSEGSYDKDGVTHYTTDVIADVFEDYDAKTESKAATKAA